MSDKWPDAVVSVVVMPGGDQDDRLLEIAEHWTSTWLLGPAIWVRVHTGLHPTAPDGVHLGEPPRITATVIGRRGRRDVDLFEFLGRSELRLLRLIAVRSVHGNHLVDDQQDLFIDILHTYLNDGLPMRTNPAGATLVGTEVRKVNLVFAAAEVGGAPPRPLIEQQWFANFVVSPEDRPTPASFDAFTRESEEDRFDGFMLANVATVAGLWSGVDKTFFEDDGTFAGTSTDQVACVRTFVRGVLSDGMVLRVAGRSMDRLLEPGAVWIAEDGSSGFHAVTGRRQDQAVKELVAAAMCLVGGQLTYQAPPGMQPIEQAVLGIRTQFVDFWGFAWDKLKALPRWILEDIRRFWSRIATGIFQGKKGRARVEIGGEEWLTKADHQLILENQDLVATKRAALDEFTATYRGAGFENFPELWGQLRTMVFNALDGSASSIEIPALKDDSNSGKIYVIGDPRVMVPPVTDSWSPDVPVTPSAVAEPAIDDELVVEAGGDAQAGAEPEAATPEAASPEFVEVPTMVTSTVEWMSLEDAERLEQTMAQLQEQRDVKSTELREQLAQVEADLQEAMTLLEDAEYELLDAQEQVEWHEEDNEADGESRADLANEKAELKRVETETETARKKADRARRLRDRLVRRLQVAEKRSEGARRDLDSLRMWIASQNLSVAGQILSKMKGERRKLDSDVSDARTWLREATPFPERWADELRAAFRRDLRIGSLIATLVAIAGVAYSQWAPGRPGFPLTDVAWWGWLIIALVVGVLALSISLIRYYQNWSAAKFQLDLHRVRADQLHSNAHVVNDERLRLDSLREPMEQFWRMMSMALHEPWAASARLLEAVGVRPMIDALPLSVRLAEPPAGRGSNEEGDLEKGVGGVLSNRGWRAEAFWDLCAAAEQVGALTPGTFGEKALETQPAAVRLLISLLDSDEVHEVAGAERLRDVARGVQTDWSTKQHPLVKDLRPDPLLGLEVGPDLISSGDEDLVPWDDHLGGVLGTGSNWSRLVFTEEAISRGVADKFSTFVLGPGRLEERWDRSHGGEFVPLDDVGTRSVELVVRVDVSPGYAADDYRVFGGPDEPSRVHRSGGLSSLAPRSGGLFGDMMTQTRPVGVGDEHAASNAE